MKKSTAVSVRLEPREHEQLQAEAKRRGVPVSELAREFIQVGLSSLVEGAEERKRRTLEALDQLASITATLPPVDAVRIARESRDELNERPRL